MPHVRARGWASEAWARAAFGTAVVLAVPAGLAAVARGGLVGEVTVTGAVTAVAMAFFVLLPLTALVAAAGLGRGGTGRRRERLDRGAIAAAIVAFAYYVFWLVGHGVLSSALAGVAAAAIGMLLAEGLRRLLSGRLHRALFTGLRRRRRFARWPALLTGALALFSLGLTGAVLLGALLAPGGSQLLTDPRPARRVIFVHLDGVGRDPFTYWVALRSTATLETLIEHGASATVAWPPRLPRESLRRVGVPLRRPPVPPGDLPRFEAVLHAVLPLPGLDPAAAAPPPPLWSIAERTGLGALMVGWEREAIPGPPPARAIAPSDHARLSAALAGDARALEGAGDRALLRRLRELARPPSEDWRRGARLTAAEVEAVGRAAVAGVPEEAIWRDRFLVRGFVELLEEEGASLAMLRLGFGQELAAAMDPTTAEAPLDTRDALVAYLDVVDEEMQALRRALRAGDTLVLLITAAEPGERPRPAPIAVFGEKARRGVSVADIIDADDVALTLFYLLGVKLPGASRGQVAWPLLTEGLAERLPPGYVARYGGARR